VILEPRDRTPHGVGMQVQVAVGLCGLVALALGITLFATTRVITRRSMDLAADDLGAARAAFSRVVVSRGKATAVQVRLITALPVLRAHLPTEDLQRDRPRLDALVDEYRRQLGAQFAILTDRRGVWTAQRGWPDGASVPGELKSAVDEALQRRSRSRMIALAGSLYLVVTEAAMRGDEILGTLTVGLAFDDEAARELAATTHSEISLLVDGRISGTSLRPEERSQLLAHINRPEHARSESIALVTLGSGGRYAAAVYPLGAAPFHDVRVAHAGGELVLLRDWRPTQMFIDEVRRQVLQGGAVVLVVALVLGVAFSGHVTRPLRDAAAAATRLAAGDWSEVPVRGTTEAATMAAAFNTMGERLRDTYERLQERTRTLEQEVAERQRAEHKLTIAKSAAEHASVAKSAFLANMSHELRTPLNSIIGYGELLQELATERGDTGYLPDLDRIVSAGRHLLSLISGVLDLSRIEAGRMVLDLEEIEAGVLLRDVLATVHPLAKERRNRVTSEGLDELGMIYSDQTKLRQVLLNVVGNACKFTEGGQVHVAARRIRTHHDTIIVDVSDTGIGMTREQMGRLFRDYAQADGSTTRRHGGAGLGLAISHRICRLLGGTISVKSELGRGSTFTITFPADAGRESHERPSLLAAS